jgi:AcrR family transcriptional regulator
MSECSLISGAELESIMKLSIKRSDIMQAALELLVEQGFHGAPMSEIARKAGVAAGTIYCYFESREALINALHEELEREIREVVTMGYPSAAALRDRFLYLGRQITRHLIAHPLHFLYLEQYYNSPYGISLHRERLSGNVGDSSLLMDIFEQGLKQGELKEFPKAALFSLSMGSLLSVMRDHILGFTVLDDVLIGRTVEACWDAIKKNGR